MSAASSDYDVPVIPGFDKAIVGATKGLRRPIYCVDTIHSILRTDYPKKFRSQKKIDDYFEENFLKIYVGPTAPVFAFFASLDVIPASDNEVTPQDVTANSCRLN